MEVNNPSSIELLELSKISLDMNTPIDQHIVDQLDRLSINLGMEYSEELVISIFDILTDPVVQPLLTALVEKIEQQFRRKTEYPILARIKTCILYFFTGNGNLTRFHRRLNFHQKEWGKALGYQKSGDGYWIPAYQTIHEFLRKYLGPAIYDNFDVFVKIVMNIAENYGLRPGWRSIVDSTPYESTVKDEDAGYSGHYKILGYKEHRLIGADTDIPFAFKVTKANEYDGNHIQDLIENAEKGNAAIAELWFDQHYASFENLSYYELVKQIKTHYRIGKDWKLDSSIDENDIHRMYQRLFKHNDFLVTDDPNCSLEFQLKFIWENSTTDSHRKAVGQFLRNKKHQEYKDSPKQYNSKQGLRSKIEGGFGVEKSFSILKLVTMRGIKSWKALISLRNFIDLVIAVFRIDLGEKTNLTSWKGVVV